jgi:DNA-binding transcriptional ArsR family regulator
MSYAQVLEALADPTRRLLFESLRRGERTVGELAELARIRQPTASQHLQTLREARLVTDRRDGTRRFYRVDPSGLAELREYIESYWDGVLAAYAGQDRTSGSAGRRRARTKSLSRRSR